MVVCSRADENGGARPRRITAVLECSRCRRKFLNEADRQLHMREAHMGIKENFECKQCGKQFGNQHILQLHTRLHASQTSNPSPEGSVNEAVTVTSTSQSNGSLNINFSVSLNINLSDGLDTLDLDSKLNELLANATKASFHEALRREKIEKLANQLRNEVSEGRPTTLQNISQNTPQSTPHSKSLSTPQIVPQNISQNVSPNEKSPSKSSNASDVEMDKSQADSSTSTGTPLNNEEKASNEVTNTCEIIKEAPKPPFVKATPPARPPVRVNPHNRPKKAVGLTKIRMEDCQRCDACSCIYLDEKDYIKHMKNFHKQDVLKQEPIKPRLKPRVRTQTQTLQARRSKRQQRYLEHKREQEQLQDQGGKKGTCRSCCKSCKCRGDHGTLEPMLPIVRPILGRSGRRSSITTQDSWNQFAQHLEGAEGVVLQSESGSADTLADMRNDPDNMADFSHLLSQVEVKIKTEPTEQEESPVIIKEEPADEMDSDSCSVY